MREAGPRPTPDIVTLTIHPWPDPVIDRVGHDPRSVYVERFWLGVLGPSTVLLLRRIAVGFDEHDGEPFDLDLLACASALGIRMGGKNSSLMRTITRACQFGVARRYGRDAISVRRKLAPVPRRHLQRLPPSVREEHDAWQRRDAATDRHVEQRARRLALALLDCGEDDDGACRQLGHLGVAAPLAAAAIGWAREREMGPSRPRR